MFYGRFEHQMDDKGRLRIPPAFRKLLGDRPMIFCGFEKCLYVYTGEEFDSKVKQRFENVDVLDLDLNELKRAIFSSVQPLTEDKQGRVSLNSMFIKDCGFKKNLITVGALDRIEIWDEDEFKAHLQAIDYKKIVAPFSSREK